MRTRFASRCRRGAVRFAGASALMGSFTFLFPAVTTLAVMPVAAVAAQPAGHPYATHVTEAAARFGISEAWIWAVMRAESNGDPAAISRAGAIGLMQVMPGTWADLTARHGLGNNPWDVRANIHAGAAYLRAMFDRYGDLTAALAAYNAGPGRVDDWRLRGRPLPAETIAYVARIAPMLGTSGIASPAVVPAFPRASVAPSWRDAALFVLRADDMANDSGVAAASQSIPQSDDTTVALLAPPSAPSRRAVTSGSPGLFVPLSGRREP